MELLELRAGEFLDKLAGPEPTPGGGSAAALAGALAASLVEMVCSMSKTRTGAPEERASLDAALAQARTAGRNLRRLVEDDSAAFDAVVAAYKLPKRDDEDKARRRAAVDAALKRATEVPLQTAEACRAVLLAAQAAEHDGNPNARSDARTGAALAWAGALGALENVRINAAPEGWGPPARKRADAIQADALAIARKLTLLP